MTLDEPMPASVRADLEKIRADFERRGILLNGGATFLFDLVDALDRQSVGLVAELRYRRGKKGATKAPNNPPNAKAPKTRKSSRDAGI